MILGHLLEAGSRSYPFRYIGWNFENYRSLGQDSQNHPNASGCSRCWITEKMFGEGRIAYRGREISIRNQNHLLYESIMINDQSHWTIFGRR